MSELTMMGYDLIIDKIVNRTVEAPEGLTARELLIWMNAYADCQDDILDIIEKLKDTNGR